MMKAMNKGIAVFLVLIMALSCVIPCFAISEEIVTFSAVSFVDNEKTTVNWWYSELDGKYYMFMPDEVDFSALKVNFSGAESIEVGGKEISDGEVTDVFSGGGEFTLYAADRAYTVVFMKSENVPAIYIETQSGSLDAVHADKSYKEKASISITQSGITILDADLSYIKGRGNSSWMNPKKPYNIKFEKKTDLFGMGKAKKWSLLALYNDKSNIRNTTVLDLAQDVGLDYTSKSVPVDLYINSDYMGCYLVCESVEVGSTRVDVEDLEDLNEEANPDIDIETCELDGVRGEDSEFVKDSQKWVNIPNDPENITGGYLLEFELYYRYDREVSGFVTSQGQDIILKSPEYASKAQVKYISSLYQEAEDALYSETGYNSLGKHFSEYFDMESFVKMYILQELSMNLDACNTSFFLYKYADSDVFYAGPAWDFDRTFGANFLRCGIRLKDPSKWYVNQMFVFDTLTSEEETPSEQLHRSFYAQFFKHKDFRNAVKSMWNETYRPLIEETNRVEKIIDDAAYIEASSVMNAFRWNVYDTSSYSENLSGYNSEVNKVKDFFVSRIEYMEKGFSDNAAYVFYDSNGGARFMVDSNIYEKTDVLIVKRNSFEAPGSNMTFVGWNTEPDGSGKSYRPGSIVILSEESTTLYAQWEQNSLSNFPSRLLSRIIDIIELMLETVRDLFGKIKNSGGIFK